MGIIRKTFLALSAVAAVALVAAISVGNRDSEALCGGIRYELHSVRHGSPPYIELTADGVSGAFLLDFGATRSSLSARVFGTSTEPVKSVNLSLPGFQHGVFELKRYDLPRQAVDWQLGVIGTDFLSLLTVQITESAVFLGEQPCQPTTMRAHGFVLISQERFFSSDPSAIDSRLPNVPIVFLRLGGARVWAQIDTGYDDEIYSHSVDINHALYERLIKDGMRLRQVSEITVSTCEGRETRPVYSLMDNSLVVETDQAQPIVRTENFYLILKQANGCGGIGAMYEPAAQLGASFLRLFRAIVFDPKSKAVWLDVSSEWPQFRMGHS
jgi:hypothetical protein